MNIRIARSIKNCSTQIFNQIYQDKKIKNTLIVSPPGCGKTTILKDLIYKISMCENQDVGVVDERGELASSYKGNIYNDLGIRTDVISNVSKSIGMKMLVRSMAPKVIVADEIGKKEDIEAIEYAMCSGVKGIYTAHGENIQDLYLNPILNKILDLKIIENIIFLSQKTKGNINKVYVLDKEKQQYQIKSNNTG